MERASDPDGSTGFNHQVATIPDEHGQPQETSVETTVTPPDATLPTRYVFKPKSPGRMVAEIHYPGGRLAKMLWTEADRRPIKSSCRRARPRAGGARSGRPARRPSSR